MEQLKHVNVCLKSRSFMMVLGRGNTDMTVLPRQFARWIGATQENGRYLQLQVPMDWMDSSDLFGHLNLEGKFIPGAIIDFLKQAQKDPQMPYFLCLDRINLSRAEYYLREVIASVETKAPLVPLIYYGRDQQALSTYGEIPALDNLYIFGTSNLDEASLPMNQKLLDKVYTVYLQPEDLNNLGEAVEEKTNAFMQARYHEIGEDLALAQEYFPLFEQLNQCLITANAYMGYRLRNDAVLYLMNNDQLPRKTAEDYMICQKVLTRLQGSEKAIGEALCKLIQILEGKYPMAAAKAKQMLEQSRSEGFGSYWG